MCPNTTKYKKKQSILPCCHDFDEVLPQETPVAPRMAQGNIKIISEKTKSSARGCGKPKKELLQKAHKKAPVAAGKKETKKKGCLRENSFLYKM